MAIEPACSALLPRGEWLSARDGEPVDLLRSAGTAAIAPPGVDLSPSVRQPIVIAEAGPRTTLLAQAKPKPPKMVKELHRDRKPGGRWGHKHPSRGKRENTKFIILHKTVGDNDETAVGFISRKGKANFVIQLDGTIVQTLGENQLAHHAGRSMWEGYSDNKNTLNAYSLGIEIVGWSEIQEQTDPRKIVTPTDAQNAAIKKLLEYLQAKYNIDDDRVLGHAQVAYRTDNNGPGGRGKKNTLSQTRYAEGGGR